MSTPPHSIPPAPAGNDEAPFWRLPRRTWLLIGAAFAIGLLLFLLLWSGRRDNDFFRAAPAIRPDTGLDYEPLPAPLPADEAGARVAPDGPADAGEAPDEMARIEEAPTPPPAPAPAPAPAPRADLAAGASPVPVETPSPRYPTRALRRGLGGTVRVRVDVGVDGVPTEVAIAEGSGMRELDRAALDAVRRWRFRPGQVEGQPVAGSVVVPIEFTPR